MAVLTSPAITGFLEAHGWAGSMVVPLAGDASFRRYFRVSDGQRRAILMDAPQNQDSRPFLAVAGWLCERGFVAPAILDRDADAGLVLLEDFGDGRMREAIDAAPEREDTLYENAVDLLIGLARQPAGPFPPYDLAVLQREAALLTEWYCPAVGLDVDVASYASAWDAVLGHARSDAPVTVLRDYHAENLMLTPRGLGLLDFQDALVGHPAYDLVSLLQDARRDVAPAVEAAMLARYCAASGAGDDFMRAYHVLGAQRNAKIVGIFTRLWRRDGKDRYLALCPRVWGYLERDLGEPVLAPVAAWFHANIPPERRGDPKALAA